MQKRTRLILLGITLFVVILIACNAQNVEIAELIAPPAASGAAAADPADWEDLTVALDTLSEEPTSKRCVRASRTQAIRCSG